MLMRSGLRESVAVAAVAAAALCPAPAGAQGGFVLGARGVEALARREAREWGENRPRRIEYASGTREHALGVIAPQATHPPSPDGGAEVDLVLLEGRFTADVSAPRGAKAPRGEVLELLVDAETGRVEDKALWPKRAPVSLRRLGHVRVLHGLGGGPHGGARHRSSSAR